LSGTHLAIPANHVPIDRQLLQSDWAARMDAARCDADFSAEPKFPAIAKLG
jgi:hypothetical protein